MKPHPFESITEEQWKSGLPRHKCALCAYDYSDPVHSVCLWPLVIVLEDTFRPESARMVVEFVGELSAEVRGVVIEVAADAAREGISRN